MCFEGSITTASYVLEDVALVKIIGDDREYGDPFPLGAIKTPT
jgi:hypothetical protein